MRVELERAMSPEDIGPDTCGLCERPFVVDTVLGYADIAEDSRAMVCPECIEYLGRSSENCPSIETYRELLAKYPEPMWTDQGEFHRYMMAASAEEQEAEYFAAALTEGAKFPAL